MGERSDNTRLSLAQQWLTRAVFLRQRWRSTAQCYVTCPGNPDGMGAQLHARLSTMLYARALGLTYAHTPFQDLQHAPPGVARWTERWEAFLGLGEGEIPADQVTARLGPPRRVDSPTQIVVQPQTFWAVTHAHTYANLFPHQYNELVPSLRARYQRASSGLHPAHRTEGACNVALHIRRGDVKPTSQVRYTAEDYYGRIVRELRAQAHRLDRPLVIRVFSQGQPGDFPALQALGVEFHLDEDLFTTFHSLTQAEVLVQAKSCLSYTAALLSEGLVVYQPTGHQPLPGWLVSDRAGGLPVRRLAAGLTALNRRWGGGHDRP